MGKHTACALDWQWFLQTLTWDSPMAAILEIIRGTTLLAFTTSLRVFRWYGPRTKVADVSVVSGTAAISSSGSSPYKFGTQGRGWQNYDYMPVTQRWKPDPDYFYGSPSTLQVLQNQANDTINFFMLMPSKYKHCGQHRYHHQCEPERHRLV